MSEATLPPTAWAVLGLLSFGRDLSGYDLKKWADSSLRFFYWSPATSQIYAELRRLEKLGFATSVVAPRDELRSKRLYRITDAGRDALRTWLHTEPDPTVLKHGTMLRVWLGHLTSEDEIRALVDRHRRELLEQLDDARYAADRAAEDTAWAFPSVVTRWAVRRIETELALLDELVAELSTQAGRVSGRRTSGI